jgi:hypothetical protein
VSDSQVNGTGVGAVLGVILKKALFLFFIDLFDSVVVEVKKELILAFSILSQLTTAQQ